MTRLTRLERLVAGMEVLVGGNRLFTVDQALAEAFSPGDELRFVEATGEVLHLPARELVLARDAVGRAVCAFQRMGTRTREQVSEFFLGFAARLADEATWAEIAAVNARDVEDAKRRGRSTTRLIANEKMRQGMVAGLRGWVGAGSRRGQVLEVVQHDGWRAELIGAELGVVGFVFEGRPNVLADATGVLGSGNTVVFRIGRDALGTARIIMQRALSPALRAAGLPDDAVCLLDSATHAAGWALFTDPRLSLAVARGSGPAVDTLGALAQSAGVPVSLHGTGGAWILTTDTTQPSQLEEAVCRSLDRKVCNSLNACCVVRSHAEDLVPALLRGLEAAGQQRGQSFKLHVVAGDEGFLPATLREREIVVARAQGESRESQVEVMPEGDLSCEWEWEETPEISLKVVPDVGAGIDLFNRYSPQFVVSVLTQDPAERSACFQRLNAPFVGDGFTRWVDGQFALRRPELGLSNWQRGRLLGRGAILSGDSVFTVRLLASGHGHGIPRSR